MNKATLRQIAYHLESEFPREACGLLITENGKEVYVPCQNKASGNDNFILDPADYAAAEDRGEIFAVIHSHPIASAQPSEADRVCCEESGLIWHIFHVSIPDDETVPKMGEMVTLQPVGYKAPLIGRPFHHGILDCYALVKDYFAETFNLTLPQPEREYGWWDKGQNLYVDNFEDAGFVRVTDEPRIGDVFLMQVRSPVPNHAAVYLGNEIILHHMLGRLSCREIYGGYWQEVTVMRVRHQELNK